MKKEKYHIEYLFENISINSLWQKVSTSFGLSEWFADTVEEDDDAFIFSWEGSQQKARIVFRRNTSIRFHWEAEPDFTFFELMLAYDELTGVTSLKIIDFAESQETNDAIMLWNTQIENLRRIIGA